MRFTPIFQFSIIPVFRSLVMLIDSHAHLEMPDFRRDLEEVLLRAKDSGIEYIFTVGTEKKDWKRALEIAQSHLSVYAILGVHPHNAKEIDHETYPALKKLCRHEKVKAYGGIIHCFSGDEKMAKACIDMGFYISIPGSITYKNAGPFHEIVKRLPLGSLLIETDAPFLTPVPFRGKRNEPSYVRYTAQKVAELKKVPFEKVAGVTTENALRVYRLNQKKLPYPL